jgi:hypothetical protein
VSVSLLVAALLVSTAGCSFIWVTRPVSTKQASEYGMLPECTSGYWMPGLDTAALALFGAMSIDFATMSKARYLSEYGSGETDASGKYTTAAMAGAMGLSAAVSAIYGYYYVAKCNKVRDAEAPETRLTSPTFRNPREAAPPPPAPAFVPLGNQRLAVLEFQGKNLEQDILMTFSDTVRGGALQGLEGYGVAVMTRENMLVLLKDMGKQECEEGDCEVETARNIGADYVVSAKVVRMEQIYVVTLKLHETKRGSLLGTDTVEGASQVDLLRSLREHARQLVIAAFGPGPDSVAPTR